MSTFFKWMPSVSDMDTVEHGDGWMARWDLGLNLSPYEHVAQLCGFSVWRLPDVKPS
jgi:hypothetical protein